MNFRKSLINFLFSKSNLRIKSLGVIGSGIMGSGIALSGAYKANLKVIIIDRNLAMLEKAKKNH